VSILARSAVLILAFDVLGAGQFDAFIHEVTPDPVPSNNRATIICPAVGAKCTGQ